MKKLFIILFTVIMLAGCSTGTGDKYYSLDHFYTREEGEAFRQAVNKLTVAMFDWYRSIEGEEGVYIIHYDFYSADLMQQWKKDGAYKSVPETDLHYYVASENYLADRGLTLSDQEKEMIHQGVRLYLIPEKLSEDQQLKEFLEEDALMSMDKGPFMIETEYSKNHRVEFRTYTFEGTLEVPGSDDINDPVILVCCCDNMKYFESESLIATGVTDSYIRLTEQAYKEFAGKNLPQELKNFKVTFKN